jgi:hypothetical protein
VKSKVKVAKYRTRNHLEAFVVCTEMPSQHAPVLGYVMDKMGNPIPTQWTPCGSVQEGRFHGYDLVEEWRDPVRYSVEVWFSSVPRVTAGEHHLADYLFGVAVPYASRDAVAPSENHRKYRITVEEVRE